MLGIVLFAFGVEEVVAHPGSRLDAEFRFAITTGVSLVLLAVVAGTYLAIRRIPSERLIGAVAMIGLAAAAGEMRGDVLAAVIVAGLIGILTWERRHRWPQPRVHAGLSEDKESSSG